MGNTKKKDFTILSSRVMSFEAYHLNKFRNFLQPPECDCGCGGYAQPVIKSTKELFSLCYSILSEEECGNCAIFTHGLNGKMHVIVKYWPFEEEYDYDQPYDPDENPIRFFGIEKTDMDFFAEMDAELGLHCYGLLIEGKDNVWTIVTE